MRFLAEFTSSPSLEHLRLPEFLSVAEKVGAVIRPVAEPSWWNENLRQLFYIFECDSVTDVKRISERCILLRAIYILLCRASNVSNIENHYSSLTSSTHKEASTGASVEIGEDHTTYMKGSYHYQVESIGRKYSAEEKKQIIHNIGKHLAHEGYITWSDPEFKFYVITYHLLPKEKESCAFFCVLLGESGRCPLLAKYDLKKRPYIGTTSMPPEESIVMVNLCQVGKGDLVYDPFCGTGSILVAAGHFRARTFGSDMDGRAMRAGSVKSQESPQMMQQKVLAFKCYPEDSLSVVTESERLVPSMLTNFKLYGLPPPDRIRFNFSSWSTGFSLANRGGFFDAILSDPPYGLREPRRKVGRQRETASNDSMGETNHSQTCSSVLSSYSTNEVVVDLVCFAAKFLVEGGLLAFWHPTTDHYTDDEIPCHPSMETIWNLPQRLSLKVVRRLVVMRKIRPLSSSSPDRLSCMPKKPAEDLRELLGCTHMPDNSEYTQYRNKVKRRREATSKFWREHSDENKKIFSGNRRGKTSEHKQTQEQIVANREKNIQIREEKHRLSLLDNASKAKKRHDKAEHREE